MTNTTEMPEKIWAEPVESGKVRGQWTKARWTDRDVPYTRTDAIPSKAEVAREFMDAVEKRTRLGLLTVQDLRDVLKEWEDAD